MIIFVIFMRFTGYLQLAAGCWHFSKQGKSPVMNSSIQMVLNSCYSGIENSGSSVPFAL